MISSLHWIRRSVGTLARKLAEFQSASALSIHSRAKGFIHYLAAFDYLAHEEVAHRQPLLDLPRGADKKVKRRSWIQSIQYLDSLAGVPALEWHYHKQINIRIPLRLAVGMRAKQDDLLRVKLERYLLAELLDFYARRSLEGMWCQSLHVIQPLGSAPTSYAFALDPFSQPGIAGLIQANEIQFIDDRRFLKRLKEIGPFLCSCVWSGDRKVRSEARRAWPVAREPNTRTSRMDGHRPSAPRNAKRSLSRRATDFISLVAEVVYQAFFNRARNS
jgi:hypothetical protein